MALTDKQAAVLSDFTMGFTLFMNDNPDVCEIFTEAWHNADNRTIRDIVDDYISELEAQP